MEKKTTIHTSGSDEIDLNDLIVQLWKKRKFILMVTGLFSLLGIFVAFTSPVSYTASCTIVPQTKQSSSGNLSGLATLAGINLGNGGTSGEILSPNVYPEIIKSVPFARSVMQTPISPTAAEGKTITLYEFYSDKRYNKPSLISILKRYTVDFPGIIIGTLKKDDKGYTPSLSIDSLVTIQTLSPQEKTVYAQIQSNIGFEANPKGGYLQISYSFPEAQGAAQITDAVRKTLEQFVITFKIEKEESDLFFVEKNYEEARKDFLQKQTNLAAYQDANRGLVTATGRSIETRLRGEYDIALTVYSELAKQREQARIAVKENKPVLTVVNPVITPTEKSAPQRGMILAVFVFLGIVISVLWIWIRPFLREIINKMKEDKV